MSRPEQSLQIAVVGFLRHAWPDDLPWWHTPNGGGRDAREAALLKAMGVTPGVPDLLFVLPSARLAAIELKSDAGRMSPAQLQLRDKLMALGCPYAICRSADDVEATLSSWLSQYDRKLNARLARTAA